MKEYIISIERLEHKNRIEKIWGRVNEHHYLDCVERSTHFMSGTLDQAKERARELYKKMYVGKLKRIQIKYWEFGPKIVVDVFDDESKKILKKISEKT